MASSTSTHMVDFIDVRRHQHSTAMNDDSDSLAAGKGGGGSKYSASTVSSVTYASAQNGDAFYAPSIDSNMALQRRLYGRDTETKELLDTFHRIRQGPSEAVIVKGVSGVGKSSLVETLRSPVVHAFNGFFVEGKFDQMHRSTPFSALTACLTDLCDLIIQSDEINLYRKRIQLAIGAEITSLESLIPNLYQVMDISTISSGDNVPTLPKAASTSTSNSPQQQHDRGKAFTRFRHLCRSFMQAVAIPEHPIVLFLDDLQWSDAGSIEILCHSFLKNIDSNHIMLVVAYRDGGDNGGGPDILKDTFFPTIARKRKRCWQVSQVTVHDLDMESLNCLLMKLTGRSLADVEPLGELVFHKTHGNCYFVRQFLEILRTNRLLTRQSPTNENLIWNIDKIQAETDISQNVVDLVTAKIKALPYALQQVLIMAAILGFAFDKHVLEEIISKESEKKDSSVFRNGEINENFDTEALLQLAIEEGLVEEKQTHSNEYKFSHDRVQQALCSMVPSDIVKQQMHLRIGLLVKQMWEAELEYSDSLPDTWKLFVACDQLNDGSMQLRDGDELLSLVRFNLQTAKVAIEKTALLPAAEYLRKALMLLETDEIWSADYELGLDLCSTAAEVEYSLGMFAECKRLVVVVLGLATCRQDTMRVNFTMLHSLSGQGDFDRALELAIDLLDGFGYKFPKNPHKGHVLKALVSTKLYLLGKSDETLLSLPAMESDDEQTIIKLLGLVYVYSYFLLKEEVLVVSILRMVKYTIKYGMSDSTCLVFTTYGFLLSVLDERASAYRFGKLAHEMCDRGQQSPQSMTRSLVVLAGFVTHYRDPIHDTVDSLTDAYQRGHASGETPFACIAASSYISSKFYIGKPLPQLFSESKALCEQMEDLGQDATYVIAIPMCQVSLNLLGECSNPTKLTGDAMVDEDIYDRAIASGNIFASQSLIFMRMLVSVFFGDWDLTRSHLRELEPVQKAMLSHYNGYLFMFLRGMCHSHHGNKKQARKSLKSLEQLLREGTCHLEPMVLLLRAEQKRMSRSRGTKDAYDLAILSAQRHDLPHHEAFANEIAGRSLEQDRIAYLTRAHELYATKWCAYGKAEQLHALLATLKGVPEQDTQSGRISESSVGNRKVR